jgi:hypothetical protein
MLTQTQYAHIIAPPSTFVLLWNTQREELGHMKYLCLCYYDTEKEAQLSQEELAAIGPACKPHDAALRATGKAVVQGSLAPYQEWKSIRPVNGRPVVTDGPLLDATQLVLQRKVRHGILLS